VRNEGDTTGRLLTVYDALPAGFTFLGMAPGGDVAANPAGTTGTITWNLDQDLLPAGQLRLVYRLAPAQVAGQYTNYAGLTAHAATVPSQPASATVVVEPAILLEDDFDAGINRWTPFLNYHRLEEGQWYWGPADGYGGSGALTHDCCNGEEEAADALMMYLGPGAELWTDYRVETRLLLRGGVDGDGNWNIADGDPIGLWVRGQYEESETRAQWVTGYYVVVAGKPDRDYHVVRLTQLQTLTDCMGDACNNPQNLYNFNNPYPITEVQFSGPYERNRWYELVVEVRGPRIMIWLDGQLAIDYTDPTEPFLSGTVGFKTHETQTASFDDLVVTRLP
jgi:hypothetical protein